MNWLWCNRCSFNATLTPSSRTSRALNGLPTTCITALSSICTSFLFQFFSSMERQGHPIKSTKKRAPSQQDQEHALELENEGHTCIRWIGLDSKLQWCRQSNCTQWKEDDKAEDMHRRDNEIQAQVRHLKAQGHTCIAVQNIYPARFSWCEQTPCAM